MLLKICGFRTETEIESVKSLHIDYLGLNFIDGARPQLNLTEALLLKPLLDGMDARLVGLFKDQPIDTVINIATQIKLDYVQLNGHEDQAYTQAIKIPIMRTIAVSQSTSSDEIFSYIDSHPAEIYILDRFNQGTGARVNPVLAQIVINKYPDKILLAGGLSATSIPDLLTQVKPYGLDISGGVRTNGYIDSRKVHEILSLIK